MEQKKERNSEGQEVVLRIYSRLSGWLSFNDDSGDITLSSYSLTGYQNEIEQALKENFACQDEAGLAPYLDDSHLKEKVLSMKPGIERWNDELWGVLTVKSSESLSDREIMRLKSEWRGQLTDGWGEGFGASKESLLSDGRNDIGIIRFWWNCPEPGVSFYLIW